MRLILKNRSLKRFTGICLIAGITAFSTSCRNENSEQTTEMDTNTTTTTDTTANRQVEVRTFTGDITTINKEANGGTDVTGTVSLRVEGDLMRINVYAEGLAPDMMHLQHLQTSQTGEDTNCPGSSADENNDGIVDVTEVSNESRGLRIIPLNMGPSNLEVNVNSYPRTNINGSLQF